MRGWWSKRLGSVAGTGDLSCCTGSVLTLHDPTRYGAFVPHQVATSETLPHECPHETSKPWCKIAPPPREATPDTGAPSSRVRRGCTC
jgi:hypothetical protein